MRDFDDPLAAARGIVNGLLLSLFLWAVLGVIGWALWVLL